MRPQYQFAVDIGGTSVAFRTRHGEIVTEANRSYGPYLKTTPEPDFVIDVTICDVGGGSSEIQVSRSGNIWRFAQLDYQLEIDLDRQRGTVLQRAGATGLDAALRIACTLLLAPRRGFLLHAASAVLNGKAYVFTGISGSGKTTLTRLAPRHVEILTDEISCITSSPDACIAFGTPFCGELGRPGRNLSAPVRSIYVLSKGSENRIDNISLIEGCRALMRNILFFASDPALTQAVFETAADLAQSVPVRRLTFRPDVDVWSIIP